MNEPKSPGASESASLPNSSESLIDLTPEKEQLPGGSSALSALGVFATKLAAKPLTIVISVLSAIYLGPEDKGFASWIVVVTSTAAFVFSFGCGAAIRFLIAGRKETLKDLAWTAIGIGLFNGLFGALLVGSLMHFNCLGGLTTSLPPIWRWSITLFIPVMVLESVLSRSLVGELRYKVVNLLELSSTLLYSVLLIALVLVAEWGLVGANFAYYGSRLFLFGGTVGYVFRDYRPIWRFDWEICRKSYSYGLRIWVGGLSSYLNMYIDSLFVGLGSTAATLGNYSVAVTIARSLLTLPLAINMVLTNRLVGLKKREAIREAALLHRSTFWLVVLTAMLIGLVGFFALPWVMPEYVETPVVFLILLVGSICMASFTIINSYFAAQGMPGRSSIAQLTGFAVGGVATPLMVGLWGGYGAAIASSSIYVIIAALMWYFFWRQDGKEARNLFAMRMTDWRWMSAQMQAAIRRLRKKKTTAKVS